MRNQFFFAIGPEPEDLSPVASVPGEHLLGALFDRLVRPEHPPEVTLHQATPFGCDVPGASPQPLPHMPHCRFRKGAEYRDEHPVCEKAESILHVAYDSSIWSSSSSCCQVRRIRWATVRPGQDDEDPQHGNAGP